MKIFFLSLFYFPGNPSYFKVKIAVYLLILPVMLRACFLFVFFCFLVNPLLAQRPDPAILKKHVAYLSSDKMKGRGTGSKTNRKAAAYVKKYFKKYRLRPLGTDGYYQPFTAKVRRVVVPDSLRPARNVIGFLDNGAEYTIVIGAHYDHLGEGRQGSSLAPGSEGVIHNGADDNASGTAGLLELARYFTSNGVKELYNLLFIAFGAEELGLLGSRHFVNNPTVPLEKINFMINMDMIGRYNPESGVAVIGYGTSGSWPEIFTGVKHAKVKYYTGDDGSGGSDNASFYYKNIPVLFFHTGGHDDYHRPTDDMDKIGYEAEAGILDIEIQVLERAFTFPKLVFKPTK